MDFSQRDSAPIYGNIRNCRIGDIIVNRRHALASKTLRFDLARDRRDIQFVVSGGGSFLAVFVLDARDMDVLVHSRAKRRTQHDAVALPTVVSVFARDDAGDVSTLWADFENAAFI